MFVKITPLDTLFFRTGRPFSMGEDTWAECLFPPSPSSLYGAIRSLMIFKREGLKAFENGRYSADIGTPSKKGNFYLKGPILFKDELFFLPPYDLVKQKSNIKNELILLKFSKTPKLFTSDYSLENVLLHKLIEHVDEATGWLSKSTLIDYFRGKDELYKAVPDKELYSGEPKIGIARDKSSLTSKEGHLYRIQMIRLKKGVSFVIWIEGIDDFPNSGILQLDGESKGARFEKLSEDLFININNIEYSFENGYFKIYLATPAIFENGWFPKWLNKVSFEGEYNGIKLKLVACVIGRPLAIGAWDVAQNKPKPLRKAVPAGSIYYFKILNNSDKENVKDVFHLKNTSDINPEEGFGLSLVGEVKV